MEHMKFETADMVAGNIEKIGALFPSAVTEMKDENGKVKKGINFEVLKQLLSRDVVDGDECYEFTWVGKKAAIAEAARPTTQTLRPVKEDSRDWDTTENLYIEGDNLEVLKILQESYLGKVKMIYIDPPYNTGHDFIYPDSYMMDNEEYAAGTGYFDEEGNVNFARENSANAGKYHSDWCSMMYSRLVLAKNLLTHDGAVFISIDDNEIGNLRKICDGVFGSANFVGLFCRKTKSGGGSASGSCAVEHDYVICYAKILNDMSPLLQKFDDDYLARYKECDENGAFFWDTMERSSTKTKPYLITAPDGTLLKGKWFRSEDTFKNDLKAGEVRFLRKSDGWSVQFKQRLADGKKLRTILEDSDLTDKKYRSLNEELENIVGCSIGHPPKPVALMKTLVDSICQKKSNAIILDFFSGSATTAHAVMQLNAEDGGQRKFIMVQLPEPCDVKSEAFKAGYKNICEIGKERIRRAGDKIKEENPLGTKDLDTGFRVFRVDSSNMKYVYYHPDELDQMSLPDMVSNIKDDRTDMDLLYACLLDWGVEISLPHTSTQLEGCTVHNVDNGALIACFNKNVPASVIAYMAKQQPLRAVFRDSAFPSDDAKINVTETFKNFSPDTSVKVL